MNTNVGNLDRLIRLLIAAVCGYLFFTNYFTGGLSYVVLTAGVVMLLTSMVGYCPLYQVLGFNSCPVKK